MTDLDPVYARIAAAVSAPELTAALDEYTEALRAAGVLTRGHRVLGIWGDNPRSFVLCGPAGTVDGTIFFFLPDARLAAIVLSPEAREQIPIVGPNGGNELDRISAIGYRLLGEDQIELLGLVFSSGAATWWSEGTAVQPRIVPHGRDPATLAYLATLRESDFPDPKVPPTYWLTRFLDEESPEDEDEAGLPTTDQDTHARNVLENVCTEEEVEGALRSWTKALQDTDRLPGCVRISEVTVDFTPIYRSDACLHGNVIRFHVRDLGEVTAQLPQQIVVMPHGRTIDGVDYLALARHRVRFLGFTFTDGCAVKFKTQCITKVQPVDDSEQDKEL